MDKISVITACLNNASTIGASLRSVRAQGYSNIEHIIIDGGSTDGTAERLAQERDRFAALVSEKDAGLYHALNKGLAKATGDIVSFLHADDFYRDAGVLSEVARAFEDHGTDSVYGDVQYVRRQNPDKVCRRWKAGPYAHSSFLKGWMPPHPAFFLKRKHYGRYGYFNTSLSISADYELMLRMLYKHKLSAHYLPEVLVRMREGGLSNRWITSRIKANWEDRKAWRINGLQAGALTLWRKPLGKVGQFF